MYWACGIIFVILVIGFFFWLFHDTEKESHDYKKHF